MGDALHRMAREAVEELLAETGHSLTIADVAPIGRLNSLAARIEHPEEGIDRALLDLPLRVGNLRLHPLTLGAAAWLEECALPWLESRPDLADLAVVYAMEHAREPTQLHTFADERELRRALKRWRRAVGATGAELTAAVEKLLPRDDETGSGEGDATGDERQKYGPIIGLLCREYGATPHYWMWEAGVNLCRAMLDDYAARQDAEAEAVKKQAQQSKTKMPVIHTRAMDRHLDFERERRALRESWLKT